MSAYRPQRNTQITGLGIPYNQGYDAHSQRNFPAAEKKGASGQFTRADGSTIDLWITDITADFSLSGQYAQSRMMRQFYPRSFNDVTLNIKGNVPSVQEYNRLALFVREHHWKALNYVNQGGSGVDQTIGFTLHNNTPKHFASAKRGTKGAHRPWHVQGYVATIAGGAKAHNVGPEFTVGFIVAESNLNANTGLWSEIIDQPQALATIIGLVNIDAAQGQTFTGYIPAPNTPKTSTKPASGPAQLGSLAGTPNKNGTPNPAPSPWSIGVANGAFGSTGLGPGTFPS